MDVGCPSCSCRDIALIGNIPSSNQFAGSYLDDPLPGGNLYRCNNCCLYFRVPHIPKARMHELYSGGNPDTWRSDFAERHDWKVAAEWLNRNSSGGTILDVGCFDGEFLGHLKSEWRKFGVEMNENTIKSAKEKGINILCKDFERINGISKKFNAVTAFDVIEHSENPRRFLEELAGLTEKGGFIILSSGNTEAPSWKFMGSKYWYCTIPEHISFINEKWCSVSAEELGLRMERIEKFSHARTRSLKQMLSELMKNVLYRVSPGAAGILRRAGFGKLDIERHNELKHHPPSWISAKDHFMVIFRKKA